MKRALITGINGQDGSYLAELLLQKGYRVAGIIPPKGLKDDANRVARLATVINDLEIFEGALNDYPSIAKCLQKTTPDEVYHLAADSFVSYEFDTEFRTLRNNINGTHAILAAIKAFCPNARFYFAGSSEVFGGTETSPQRESTPHRPRSIYGISKASGYELTRYYREVHGLFACSGILYNHESPRRSPRFVTRKITRSAAMIKMGTDQSLELGNLDAVRDWGYAGDYVKAMWMMLQQYEAEDYVVCTGVGHTVRDFCRVAFEHVGLNYLDHVRVAPRLIRRTSEARLVGDFSKARIMLGWNPTVPFDDLVRIMVEADIDRLRSGELL